MALYLPVAFAILFTSICSASVWANEEVARCVTPALMTSYFLERKSDHFILSIHHHHGVEKMPIDRGTVTPSDLNGLERRAEKMMRVGSQPRVRFERSECRQADLLWRCFSNKPRMVGDLEIEKIGFAMGRLKSDYNGTKWTSIETFLHLTIDNELVTVPVSFPESNCRTSR